MYEDMLFLFVAIVLLVLLIITIIRESKRRTVELKKLEELNEKIRILKEINGIVQKYVDDEYERFHAATIKLMEESQKKIETDTSDE